LVTATGNVTGGNITTGGVVSATGNITGANVNTNAIVGTALTLTSTGVLNLNPTGNIALSANTWINNLATPVEDADAANKGYVDAVAQGLDIKASVGLATTSALAAYTYNNGTSGVGATITANANGALSIDGTVSSADERVLIKNETGGGAPYNGIYVVTQIGSAGTPFILTRAVDFNAPAEIPGAFTFVEYGTTNPDTGWVCTTNSPVTVGTTNIVFAQFSGAGSYTANTQAGISLTGSVFSALVDGVTTAFDGGGNIIVKASANLTTPNIGAATGTSLSTTGNVTAGITGGLISATSTITSAANITGANLLTGGLISAVATITGGNLATGGTASATGNITGGNVLTGGLISATGNITGNYFIGNGSQLTGVTASSVDANNLTGNTLSSNVLFSSLTSVGTLGNLAVSGNVTGGNLLTGGLISATSTITSAANITGANLLTSGLISATATITGGNLATGGTASATGNITGGNVLTGGLISATATITGGNLATGGTASATGNITGGNVLTGGLVSATGNVTGNYFIGNGSQLTGIDAAGIQSGNSNVRVVSAGGNVAIGIGGTANIAVFATTGAYVTGVISANGNVTGGNILTGGL